MRELLGVLEDLPVPHGAVRLVTCAALLDVLAEEELAGLARLVVNAEGPALLSLSVDGRVAWSPPDPADDLVAQAFDRHQRRDGRAGPDAPRLFEGLLAGLLAGDTTARCRLLRAEVDWLLGPERPELLRRWLDERVQAVLDQWLVDPLDDQAGDRIDTDPGEPPDRRGQRDPDGPFAEPVAPVVLGWHERRLEQMAEGRLRVRVGHVDLLVLLRRG